MSARVSGADSPARRSTPLAVRPTRRAPGAHRRRHARRGWSPAPGLGPQVRAGRAPGGRQPCRDPIGCTVGTPAGHGLDVGDGALDDPLCRRAGAEPPWRARRHTTKSTAPRACHPAASAAARRTTSLEGARSSAGRHAPVPGRSQPEDPCPLVRRVDPPGLRTSEISLVGPPMEPAWVHDECAGALTPRDVALSTQHVERLRRGRPRNPPLGGQLPLRWNLVTGTKLTTE